MKRLSVILSFVCLAATGATRTDALRERLDSPDRNHVFVTMHRGDWRHAPENSVGAIQGAIAMGADIIELDVAKTKDGHLVLLHDGTLDRVSNGSGPSTEYTLEEIKSFRLKGIDGETLTDYGILTLKEAFALTKGRILVNIDKFERDPKGVAECARRCGIEREVILKGSFMPDELKTLMGDEWRGIMDGTFLYMPIICIDRVDAIERFEAWQGCGRVPFAYELCFAGEEQIGVLTRLEAMQGEKGPRIWLNTLWDSLCAGHTDELGYNGNIDNSWGWCLKHGATMIQTDRPSELMRYLEAQGRRAIEQ